MHWRIWWQLSKNYPASENEGKKTEQRKEHVKQSQWEAIEETSENVVVVTLVFKWAGWGSGGIQPGEGQIRAPFLPNRGEPQSTEAPPDQK